VASLGEITVPTDDGSLVLAAQRGDRLALERLLQLHYDRIYAVPGLYEHVVQERLQCRSPQVAAEGFLRGVAETRLQPSSLTVLDVGAGTGLVGDLLVRGGIRRMVGVDALPAAREACMRDRPGVYGAYLIGDLASGDSTLLAGLREQAPGGLVSAGAFGGTHAPPAALINALALLPSGAPVALTIDERWMDASDPDGFGVAVQRLIDQGDLEVVQRTRFKHRITTTGEPIFYELLVGTTAR
jgi:hypothetical protein